MSSSTSKDNEDADLRERLEFERRLRERDHEATRKKGQPSARTETQMLEEIARLQGLDPTKDRDKLTELIRIKRRQEYVKARESKKIKLLKDELKDEKTMFQVDRLTQAERKRLENKEKMVELAEQLKGAQEKELVTQYHMPETKPLEYKEDPDDPEKPNKELRNWEEERLGFAKLEFGSKDKAKVEGRKRYNYVGDDEELREQELKREKATSSKPNDPYAEAKEKIRETQKSLPVYKFKDKIIELVRKHQVLVIEGETGCGKTTQIPQYLADAGFAEFDKKTNCATKRIGCTQPRRIAAMSVAARVAQEYNAKFDYKVDTKLGDKIGYSIRFEDCSSDATLIKYMTDGMLLREFLDSPTLEGYSVIIIDEAHERTLHTDILFGLVRDILKARSDFRLIISSATLDTEKFREFFDGAPLLRIPGRVHNVDVFWSEAPVSDYLSVCVHTVLKIHKNENDYDGDILVFLPGQEEIEWVQENLEQAADKLEKEVKELRVMPLFANLPTDLQASVFEPTPTGARKVVLATNIAETSLTIDGIVYVIDSGFYKVNFFNPRTRIDSLVVQRVSKASAKQRKGRAGRVREGQCYRLFTREEYTQMDDDPVPEIQRVNLGNVVLLLKTMYVNDIFAFDYLDPPPQVTLVFAAEQLYALGAMNEHGQLTTLGRKMADFPIDPMMSKALIASEKYKCSQDVLTIISMLNINGAIFYRPKDKAKYADEARKSFYHTDGDHIMLLNIYNNWAESGFSKQWCSDNFVQYRSMCRARDVFEQMYNLMERAEIKIEANPSDTVAIRKAILSGFYYNIAKVARHCQYKTWSKQQSVYIHPTSALFEDPKRPRVIMYNDILETKKEHMRFCSRIEPEWLLEIAPHCFKKEEVESLIKKKMPKVVDKVS
ncbi:Pre-mRNA-splicing factor ATP-dependent RNA helicase DHX16, partial [Fragariocoptes setiger]